jgi:hypothetical protein
VLARRLAGQGTPRIRIAVARDAARLPLADGAVAGVVLEHAAMVSMGATRRRWPAVARELRRVLAPGGTVLITAAGFRLPGLGAGTESLNRALKRRPAERRARIPGLSDIVGGMAACGFAPPEIYAPLPAGRNTACVVPLGDAGAVGTLLEHLVDAASPLKRAAALVVRGLAGTGLLARLAQECWLIWGGAGAPG